VTISVGPLAIDLAACNTSEQLIAFLPRLNGFYAWVEQSPGQIRAAVDHIRSRPLFYGLTEGRFYLSDDAEWVRQQVGDREMDPVAREEFQLAGYVTGADTLFPDVKQLQAGECLIARQTEAGPVVETHRYYRFLHQEPAETNEPDLRAELVRVTVRVMQRLIDYANGRQIVIPLSGGYDSRLIATMLKRLGYGNVLTFTYGVPGNKESDYSKRVADALGLRWHFVEYSESLWREAWQTTERWEYQKWASGWNSIAHVQDWLAVQKLKQGGVIEADAIFVPGHTGDFVAGSHIPDEAFERTAFDLEDIEEAILRKHYSLAPMKLFSISSAQWHARIRERTERTQCAHPFEFADGFEKWDWQERQAKFICNSVRVYEFYGYDWWMPLWDLEFMRFWEEVPLALRKGREWYVSYAQSSFKKCSVRKSYELKNASDDLAVIALGKALISPSRFMVKALKSVMRPLVLITKRKTGLAMESRYVSSELNQLVRQGYSSNGRAAHFFLNDTSNRLDA
jgi:asparagine synthase (glutamine-hydrolysing)